MRAIELPKHQKALALVQTKRQAFMRRAQICIMTECVTRKFLPLLENFENFEGKL